jgi:hypothetical protein
MRRVLSFVTVVSLACCLAPAMLAESHNPADYPLRIHIYQRNQTTFYQHREEEEAKGEGRANLFEGGEPKGIDFQFECDTKLQTSSGFETFPARWKKPGQELVVLQPQFGRNGYNTCRLKVLVKDFVYVAHDGHLISEPANLFKQWMTRHDYDPEHGKDMPIQIAPPANNQTGAVPARKEPTAQSTPPLP